MNCLNILGACIGYVIFINNVFDKYIQVIFIGNIKKNKDLHSLLILNVLRNRNRYSCTFFTILSVERDKRLRLH